MGTTRWSKALGMACAVAAIGCGDGSGQVRSGDGGVQTSFRCELGTVVDHYVDMYVDADDWDGTRADLSAHELSDIDPGDTIAVRVTFVEPILVEEGSPSPSRFVISTTSEGEDSAQGIDTSLTFQGTLGLALSDARFFGTANDGTLDGLSVDIGADPELSPGEVLSCVSVKMTVPSAFDSPSSTVADGQALRFDALILER